MHALITPHLWTLVCPTQSSLFPGTLETVIEEGAWPCCLRIALPPLATLIKIVQMKESISIPRTQCPVVCCFRPAFLMGDYQGTSLPSAICIQNGDLVICLLLTHANETRADGEIQFPQLPVVLNMNAEPEVASLKNRPRLGGTGEVVVFVCYLVWQGEGPVQFTAKNCLNHLCLVFQWKYPYGTGKLFVFILFFRLNFISFYEVYASKQRQWFAHVKIKLNFIQDPVLYLKTSIVAHYLFLAFFILNNSFQAIYLFLCMFK